MYVSELSISVTALAMGLGLILDAVFGWPEALFKRVGHPVSWMGTLITVIERLFNKPQWPDAVRSLLGVIAVFIVVGVTVSLAWWLQAMLPHTPLGWVCLGVLSYPLIASRSLYDHINAVFQPLAKGNMNQARHAVSYIVSRDPKELDETGLARASIESLAENTSDGIIAPLFWGLIFGLPGIAGYKAINTLDSMIGYKNERYKQFGWAGARLDDLANLIPARLTGMIFCIIGFSLWKRGLHPVHVMFADASHHRSPNAGWPEAAMAGCIDISLSGPRIYDGKIVDEPVIHSTARSACTQDIRRALVLYLQAMIAVCICLAGMAVPAMTDIAIYGLEMFGEN